MTQQEVILKYLREGAKLMGRTRMSQIKRIDQYIKDFGSITILDAFRDLGIANFTARISNMREQGYPLVGTWEESKNRYGEKVRYMRYTYGNKETLTADVN